ncbi:MAG: single-stranded DNA-binding protein [Candidatus Levybacteria bacterium]|nr:single-stranded DNA-binding protein [Candidatus Levybacteria bacterium]
MARSLNRVELIGNLTRDPELRYTPSGTAVCTFGLATNRSWTTETGEKKEDTEFHRIVAWSKLAELCSQFLVKGRKVYVQGRIATRNWTGQDGQQRTTVEIVIDDMILLDSPRGQQAQGAQASSAPSQPSRTEEPSEEPAKKPVRSKTEKPEVQEKEPVSPSSEEVNPDDIPF